MGRERLQFESFTQQASHEPKPQMFRKDRRKMLLMLINWKFLNRKRQASDWNFRHISEDSRFLPI